MLSVFKNLQKLFYNYKKLKLNRALKTIIKDLIMNLNSYKETKSIQFEKLKKSRKVFLYPHLAVLVFILFIDLFVSIGSSGSSVFNILATVATLSFICLFIHFLRAFLFYFGWVYFNLKELTKP